MSDETKTSETHDEIEAGAQKPAPESAAGQTPAVEELQAQLQATRDQLLRTAAELDNMRKRAARDVHDARAYAVTGFARDLLSVEDNLARALQAITPQLKESMGEAGRSLVDGVEITQRELIAALARHGVRPIPAEPGGIFDPNLHQAAAQVPSDKPAGAIVDVVQGGWTIGERVLRAAMVVVSAGPPAGTPTDGAAPSTADYDA